MDTIEAKVANTGTLLHKHGNRNWHWITDSHTREGGHSSVSVIWIGDWTLAQKAKYGEIVGNGMPEGKGEKVVKRSSSTRESSGSDKTSVGSKYKLERI